MDIESLFAAYIKHGMFAVLLQAIRLRPILVEITVLLATSLDLLALNALLQMFSG
jgi:hypothetical protein